VIVVMQDLVLWLISHSFLLGGASLDYRCHAAFWSVN